MKWIVYNPVRLILISILFLVPQSLFAALKFSEVMYDLSDGSDAGREWIEVRNAGSESVDLRSYKLFENKSNHDIKFASGSSAIAPGGFAVIAADAKKFLIDHPGFASTLFDSAFLLSNEGEMLVLRDAHLTDVDRLSYTSSQGAAGNGESLQRIDNRWVESAPTPGAQNILQSSSVPAQVSVPQRSPTREGVLVSGKQESTRLTRNQEVSVAVVSKKQTTGQSESRPVTKVEPSERGSNGVVWFVALAMVLGIAIAGFLLVNRGKELQDKAYDEADEYEIIE